VTARFCPPPLLTQVPGWSDHARRARPRPRRVESHYHHTDQGAWPGLCRPHGCCPPSFRPPGSTHKCSTCCLLCRFPLSSRAALGQIIQGSRGGTPASKRRKPRGGPPPGGSFAFPVMGALGSSSATKWEIARSAKSQRDATRWCALSTSSPPLAVCANFARALLSKRAKNLGSWAL
jgi:hypothetical protein